MNSLFTTQVIPKLRECFDTNDEESAQAILRECLQDRQFSSSDRAQMDYYLGRIAFYHDAFDESESWMRRALNEDANHTYAKVYLAKIAQATGNKELALSVFSWLARHGNNMDHLVSYVADMIASNVCPDAEMKTVLEKSTGTDRTHSTLPKVSIFILCHNGLEYTERCLRALSGNTSYPNYEVLVVDNASVDDTPAYLETFSGRVKFIRSSTNRGFVGGNNYAASFATGEYIVFLNNDTEVRSDWLEKLLECFFRDPHVGAAGSQLIYPNDVLQEAGGIIFSDGCGWNYGKGSPKGQTSFLFQREVDYCSGAALMVRKSIFDKLNGFDERYAPAYYEDADLCFSIRKLGYKVVYCPFSSVVHFEGATAGTDVQVGFKKYQVLNAPKFKEKWRKELALQCPNKPEEVLPRASNRSQGPRILIIDDWLPLPDRASGTLRLYLTVKQLCKMGYQVTFVFMSMPRPKMNSDMYVEELQALGVEFIWFEFDLWWELRDSPIIKATHKRLVKGLELRKRKYDRIYICFWWVANYFIDYIREEVPDTPVIIDSEDLHYLREQRQAEITKSKELEKTAAATKKKELAVYAKADCVTTVTEEDRAVLLADLKGMPVMVIPNIHDAVDIDVPYEQRKDFLFIGNFNHGPNQDAVLWFAQDIFPSILKKLPESKFYIVGNNPTQKVHDLASEHIVVTGWVPEVKPYLSKCRVSVIPLRFGAGMKGKVGETMSHGLPMVSTTVGTEGMRIVPQEHAFVTDHAQEFARYAVQLYSDKAIWEEMSRKGKDLISSQYSSEMLAKRMEYLLSFDRKGFTSYRAHAFPHPPKVSIIIPVSGQWKYTKECLESIRKDTAISHEIIVIDNASKDSTLRELRRYPEVRLICNENNLGFPAAMNQGMAAAVGEHILLLNNDTVVSLGWLERMVELAESDATIGLVGPVSNKVSGVQIDKEAKYSTPAEMQAYAQKIAEEKKGIVRDFPRIAFLCTLIKRSLFDCLGGLDERFSPGNFEDDDYCLRAQIAGYKSVIAEDVFIHHYGSVSWQADGEERYRKLLQFNGEKFKAKWGGSPEDIWLRGAPVRKRNVKIPIDKDRFVQEFEQTTILAKEKDGEQALMHARRAVAVYHQSQRKNSLVEYPVVLSLAGNLALMNGELDEARQYFEEEIRLTPGSLRASLGLARVFKKAGLAEASRTMYEAALQLDPENEALKSEMETLNVPQEEERAVV